MKTSTPPQKKNILVVSTEDQHRSVAAAHLLENEFGLLENKLEVSAQACGIGSDADQPVTQDLIDWSDYIIAMEERTDGHKTYLQDNLELGNREVFIFDIPDTYKKNDPELIELLKQKLQTFIQRISKHDQLS